MIQIFLQRDESGEIHSLKVNGHAGFAESGQDIVCAGVSALTQSALLGLQKFLPGDFNCLMESGQMEVTIREALGPNERLRADLILETMMLGIGEIARQYPQYLRVKLKTRRGSRR